MKFLLIFLISFNSLAASPLPIPRKKELKIPTSQREKKNIERKKEIKLPKPSKEYVLPLR